ncbi:MAG: efflux RND transporter periplasmic adaptor subunit [Endomicrobiia bacterium]
MKRKIIMVVLAAGILTLTSYRIFEAIQKRKNFKKEFQKETEYSYIVSVKKAIFQKIPDSINFVGEIKGINEITVIPKVTGRLLRKIKDEGSFVNKDEVICEIDRDEPALKFSLYELKSPISGILARYFVDVGAMVSPQTPICIISDTNKVKVIFNIDEKLVNKIKSNSYVKIETETGEIIISNKLQTSNYIDPLSRTMEVRVVLENPQNSLKSGAFVKGELIFYEKTALVVPVEAVYDIDSKKIAFVVKDNNTVEEREVKTGLKYKDVVEIISGINKDEKVVYKGGELLVDGMKVEVAE